MNIILASKSKRRIEIMKSLGFVFTIAEHMHDEEMDLHLPADEYVMECSLKKALSVEDKKNDSLIIGADTVVCLENEIIGKPKDIDDARRMLMKMSGKTHQVLTGMTLLFNNKKISGIEKTNVTFKKLDEDEIIWYLKRADYMDKAGAYAIQEEASFFIERIDGDYFNVVGFPVFRFSMLYKEAVGEHYYKLIDGKNRGENLG